MPHYSKFKIDTIKAVIYHLYIDRTI